MATIKLISLLFFVACALSEKDSFVPSFHRVIKDSFIPFHRVIKDSFIPSFHRVIKDSFIPSFHRVIKDSFVPSFHRVIHPANHNRGGVFLGTAYDVVRGNPHGSDIGHGGLDPGLKRTAKILKTTNFNNPNSDCPDQANCVPVGTVCSTTVEESLILDTNDYVNSFSSSLNFEASGTDPYLLTHTGGLSLGFDRAVQILENQERSILFRKSVCVFGETAFKSDREERLHEVELDEYFVASVCRLVEKHSDRDLLKFFNQWGTHAITGLTVGTKEYEQSEVDKVELIRSMQTSFGINIFYEVGYFNLFTANVSPSAKITATENIRQFHTYSNTLNFTSGTKEFPEPIRMRLRSLEELMDVKYFPENSLKSCPTLRSADTVSQLKNIVEHGLMKYPQWVGAEKNLTALLRQIPAMTHWPAGSYGFLKTTDACPAGWYLGQRFHDTANCGSPSNSWSAGFGQHTSTQVWTNDIRMDFCMKENDDPSATRSDWPSGSYCIFKSRSSTCPYGFSEGRYEQDDDDIFNKNWAQGVLPDGSYDTNTEYKFCCRDDASPFKPIFLPLEKDFILMPKRGTCQEVFGMTASMHFIRFDCENHWWSGCSLSGNHPYGYMLESGDFELFFCAYTRIKLIN